MARLLLFGANGAIGSAIAAAGHAQGWEVTGALRNPADSPHLAAAVAYTDANDMASLTQHAPFDAVCWAQGANCADSVYAMDEAKHLELYQANCLFILNSLAALLAQDLLSKPSRMVVISSIWQTVARQQKLSYTMSKAALSGLVQSAAIDLGADGHLINAVLPGVLDTPMTRANLLPAQLDGVIGATKFQRLATPDDVSALVMFLCSTHNRSITGQSIAVDLGFSHAHCI